jgi:hypothetical protein
MTTQRVEQYTCCFRDCGATFDNPIDMLRHYEEVHGPGAEEGLDRKLDALSKSLEEVRKGIADMGEGIGKALIDLNQRIAKLESAKPEKPPEEKPEKVELGAARKEAEEKAMREAAEVAAEVGRKYSIADELAKLMPGIGQLLQGIAAVRGGATRESPFEEAGRAMFTTWAKVMTETIARISGRAAAEQAIEHE